MFKQNARWINGLYGFIEGAMILYVLYYGVQIITGSASKGRLFLLIQVVAGMVLATLPFVIEYFGHFKFSEILKAAYLVFIFAAILLGTGLQFYSVPYWDKFLHLISATMLAGFGYAIFGVLTPKNRLKDVSPLLISIFALCFGLSIGVLWEFYEFTGDGLLGLNMQRAATSSGTLLRGRAALMDTMGDLFADAGGSLLLAVIGWLGIRKHPQWLDKFLFQKSKV